LGSGNESLKLLDDYLGIVAGPLTKPRIWLSLGWLDVIQNYRRTFLGPFWIILQMVIFSIAMTVVLASMFGVPTEDYAAHVVTGMIAWTWISAVVLEGGGTFLVYGQYIKSVPFDKAHFIWASAFKQVVIFAHNLVVYAGLVVLGVVEINLYTLMIFPSLLLMFLMSLPLLAVVAIMFSRYRDMQKLVSSSIIIVLMLTPIFWLPEFITGWRTAIYIFNPIYYVVEIIRKPLMGLPVSGTAYLVVSALTFTFWVLGAFCYKRYHRFVIFWI
jgi:ABC-type polysaccharide/polyol phosphate export permease